MSSAGELDFDWTVPGALGRGYLTRLRAIQDVDPLFWSAQQNAWIVTRHADILAGLRDPRLSNSRYHLGLEAGGQRGGATLDTVRRWIFNQDGRAHMRLRKLLLAPFSRTRADAYRGDVRRILERYLDELGGVPSVEFSSAVANPFVAEVLLHILGFTGVLSPQRLMEMAATIVTALVTAGDAASIARADAAIGELSPLIVEQIEDRRRRPTRDLLTSLVQQFDEEGALSNDDIISLFHVLMLAAIDTTANTLSLIVAVLDEAPQHRDFLRQNPERLTDIVEEMQRFVGMQNMIHRRVAEPFEWHGRMLAENDMVMFMLAAGNMDPRTFDHPDRIDVDRPRRQPLSFAPGLHHCIGVHIAKMELEEALAMLYDRFDRVRVLQEPEYQSNYMTRCFTALEVRFEGDRAGP